MNRTELIDKIATSANLTKTDTRRVVRAFEQVITDELARGGDVSLVGFGRFSVIRRVARMYRHPGTGKKIAVQARKAIKFKAGKYLAEAVK